MLVLSRRVNERIWVGENIEIVVIDIKDQSIRLGISAPKEVQIYRAELVEKQFPRGDKDQKDQGRKE